MLTPIFRFLVKGSSPDPYIVAVHKTSKGAVRITCTCRAGENGQHCKHRVALILGDISALVSGNENDITMLHSLLKGDPILTAIGEVGAKEKAFEAAKRALAQAKRDLAAAMNAD